MAYANYIVYIPYCVMYKILIWYIHIVYSVYIYICIDMVYIYMVNQYGILIDINKYYHIYHYILHEVLQEAMPALHLADAEDLWSLWMVDLVLLIHVFSLFTPW